jgi:anti-anti-sigma regulatory factor
VLGFRRRHEFAERAGEFLAEGLAAGERVLYVASGDPGALAAHLGTRSFDEHVRRGAVQLLPVDSAYPAGTVVDPAAQVGLYATATEAALAAGYTGLRVAAEVTSLARTPAQLDAFARYEHLADRYMAAHPMTAMCGYDVGELGEQAVTELACLHSRASEGVTSFHLHGHARGGCAAALDGELDMRVRQVFPRALERADLQPAGGTIVLDAGGLTFIDHRSLLDLADYAERRAATVVLRTRLSTAARLVELLDLARVRVECV